MIHRRTSVLLVVSVLLVGGALWFGLSRFTDLTVAPPAIAGIFFAEPKVLEEFALQDQAGAAFQRARLLGKWTWLYFGYTSCPDACPLTLTIFNQVQQRLAQEGRDDAQAYVLVSVDPERDTPERLQVYTSYFNPKFLGVTGTPEALAQLAQQCLVLYRRTTDQQSAGGYTIDHSSNILLIDPQARLRAVFRPPHIPETLVSDWQHIQAYVQAHP